MGCCLWYWYPKFEPHLCTPSYDFFPVLSLPCLLSVLYFCPFAEFFLSFWIPLVVLFLSFLISFPVVSLSLSFSCCFSILSLFFPCHFPFLFLVMLSNFPVISHPFLYFLIFCSFRAFHLSCHCPCLFPILSQSCSFPFPCPVQYFPCLSLLPSVSVYERNNSTLCEDQNVLMVSKLLWNGASIWNSASIWNGAKRGDIPSPPPPPKCLTRHAAASLAYSFPKKIEECRTGRRCTKTEIITVILPL